MGLKPKKGVLRYELQHRSCDLNSEKNYSSDVYLQSRPCDLFAKKKPSNPFHGHMILQIISSLRFNTIIKKLTVRPSNSY